MILIALLAHSNWGRDIKREKRWASRWLWEIRKKLKLYGTWRTLLKIPRIPGWNYILFVFSRPLYFEKIPRIIYTCKNHDLCVYFLYDTMVAGYYFHLQQVILVRVSFKDRFIIPYSSLLSTKIGLYYYLCIIILYVMLKKKILFDLNCISNIQLWVGLLRSIYSFLLKYRMLSCQD